MYSSSQAQEANNDRRSAPHVGALSRVFRSCALLEGLAAACAMVSSSTDDMSAATINANTTAVADDHYNSGRSNQSVCGTRGSPRQVAYTDFANCKPPNKMMFALQTFISSFLRRMNTELTSEDRCCC